MKGYMRNQDSHEGEMVNLEIRCERAHERYTICQIPYIRYTYSGNLLFAKTIICIISVVKANCVKDKVATGGVWRE